MSLLDQQRGVLHQMEDELQHINASVTDMQVVTLSLFVESTAVQL